MLFRAPELDARERAAIESLAGLREDLQYLVAEPRRWGGSLRRMSFARNIRGSNSIEGLVADVDDAAAVAQGEEPLDADSETRLALAGYRSAMTYVLQLGQDDLVVSVDLVRALHYMLTSYDLSLRPGRWRAGPIYVRDDESGRIVHEGADVAEVPRLMEELAADLAEAGVEPIVAAAMAHLNLAMIRPFRDGNGRMARVLQSLVLSRSGEAAPVFLSIEEYLGRNTAAYYDVLARVGGGSWSPERDARPWLRFAITAHLRQAATMRQRIRDAEHLWDALERLVAASTAPSRALPALFDAAYGYRIRRGTYMATLAESGDEVSEQVATRDLVALAEAGLLIAEGERRGRVYRAGAPLRALRDELESRRDPRPLDPFAEGD